MLAILALLLPQGGSPDPAPLSWDDFPAFVWRDGPGSAPSDEGLAGLEPFGGVIVLRSESSEAARARGLAHLVWNAPGRGALHVDATGAWRDRVERWIATRDASLLVRAPCLSDPDVRRELERTLAATLERHGTYPGAGFVLGDEVALTPDGAPFDLCRGEHCESAWREWARAHDWPARAPDTDEARHGLGRGDHAVVGAWLARRRFDRERLTALLESLAERTRAAGIPAGLLGAAGTSTFGALDLASLTGFALTETYPRVDARLLERRAEGPAAVSLATLFLADETPDGAAWLTFEHWAGGGRGLVLWSQSALREPARRTRLIRALEDVRALARRKDLRVQPNAGTIAIVHDPDSVAYRWLEEHRTDRAWPRSLPSSERRTGAFPRKVERWQRALAGRAREPTAVTFDAGDAQRRARAGLLVLIEAAVLDPGDIGLLEAHLDRGGALAFDGRPGRVDRRGRPRPGGLEALFERAPERVFVLDSDALPLASAWLERVESAAGLAPLPLPVLRGDAARQPWRVSARPLVDRPASWRVVLLPDTSSPRQRARELVPLTLDLEPRPGWRLDWIHPPPAPRVLLPAGDAAVLVLTPEVR